MSSDEWTTYYEENLAMSDMDNERIAELETMQLQLEQGEEIDEVLEKLIVEEVIAEASDPDTLIAFGYEIKDWKSKLFWFYMSYMILAVVVGFFFFFMDRYYKN
jgi:regulator of RNase E activity RraB